MFRLACRLCIAFTGKMSRSSAQCVELSLSKDKIMVLIAIIANPARDKALRIRKFSRKCLREICQAKMRRDVYTSTTTVTVPDIFANNSPASSLLVVERFVNISAEIVALPNMCINTI